ncbi:DUF2931 family protein [Pseudomonas putida]|uniref:DUF2931 family protein n=1 Tax=Pseudomonas putida TaxID=303 RepID=UPI00236466C4|nr:DUF2931 family protein [Pseudomonas putida]MDD1969149.1 DUF2931 family protein [Pseudomonas putida]
MNKFLSLILTLFILSGCTAVNSRSLPYDAWRLGFFAPSYMEVWIETADAIGIDGMVRIEAARGIPAMSYPSTFSEDPPDIFKGKPAGWPARMGWGKGKYIKGAALPKQIYVRWQSLVEPQIYHTRIDIPESIREIMRKKDRAFCQFTGKTEVQYRKAIVIGLAPGGIAKAWVTGPCLTPIEIGRVQATVDPTGPYDGKSGGKYRPLSPTSKAYVEKFGVPYGSW